MSVRFRNVLSYLIGSAQLSRIAVAAIACLFISLFASVSQSQEAFPSQLRSFLNANCIECHSGAEPDGKLDLEKYADLGSISKKFQTWREIKRRVETGNMPPKLSIAQPSEQARREFAAVLSDLLRSEATKFAGDPGPVSVRRLNHAEYNNSVRDLIGVDLKPAREFPIDPANEAGFDNSAESLVMSPALMNKYLAAARNIASHMLLTPEAIAFASHPVLTDTDRDKYCVQRIVDFYKRQPTDIADYLFVAWKFKSTRRKAIDQNSDANKLAKQFGLSPKYLAVLIAVLDEPEKANQIDGPMSEVRRRWHALSNVDESNARNQCVLLRDFILEVRSKLEPKFNMRLKGIHDGAQAFVLWKNRQMAKHRRSFLPQTLKEIAIDKLTSQVSAVLRPAIEALSIDAAQDDLKEFCSTFPDAFYVSERGRDYLGVPKEKQEKGRLLSAGFHSMMGYFRDDQPLCEMILSDADREELERLWRELDFVTAAPIRQYQGFLWFERTDHHFLRDAQFDFARPENKEALSESSITQLAQLYLDKAISLEANDEQRAAIAEFFTNMNHQIRWVERTRLESQAKHLEAMVRLAERAFRGQIEEVDRDRLRQYYTSLRENEALSHEEAIQDLLVSILISPEFCYRSDLSVQSSERTRLNEFEIANRLSYFLWASSPDQRLLDKAMAGLLRDRSVLLSEVDRMLRDDKVRGLAVEFGSQWLDFQRFQSHNSVDRNRFPQFTDSLREAMFEEPIRFMMDMIQNNRSIMSCIDAQYTFVNPELAKHYGLPVDDTARDGDWWRVADPTARGGLLPMAVFMTQNAPGLRTSPVKRGYWVVRRLLGEQIPPPPPNVPELPVDESQLGELSLRQTLEKHRQLESCAVCHDRFDAIGLAFESYGPIGERRERDLGDKPIDDSAVFPNGQVGKGLLGLREYLKRDRRDEFQENLCRKLLSFALGRTLILSDDLLIEEMQSNLRSEDNRFGSMIKSIVLSSQFLEKRGSIDSSSDKEKKDGH